MGLYGHNIIIKKVFEEFLNNKIDFRKNLINAIKQSKYL